MNDNAIQSKSRDLITQYCDKFAKIIAAFLCLASFS